MDRTEAENAAAKRTAEEARAAAEREVKATQERFAAAGFRDPARLAPIQRIGSADQRPSDAW